MRDPRIILRGWLGLLPATQTWAGGASRVLTQGSPPQRDDQRDQREQRQRPEVPRRRAAHFNSQLRLSPHFHSFLPDGVFALSEPQTLTFVELPPPSDDKLASLLWRCASRIERLVDLHGAHEIGEPDEEQLTLAHSLSEAAQPAAQARLPAGLYLPPPERPGCAQLEGYSLHAAGAIRADDRQGLERLLRYGARSPLCQTRLSLTPSGAVRYRLRKPAFDGRTVITLEPEAFVRRLAALIPPPWLNLIRFHGVFAPRSKHRHLLRQLLPQPTAPGQPGAPLAAAAEGSGPHNPDLSAPTLARDPAAQPLPVHLRIAWHELLRRSFAIDVLSCPRCHSGRMRLLAVIKDKQVVDKILTHLGLPTEPPPAAPPRAPPQMDFDRFDEPAASTC